MTRPDACRVCARPLSARDKCTYRDRCEECWAENAMYQRLSSPPLGDPNMISNNPHRIRRRMR